jgi:hypothetical protein
LQFCLIRRCGGKSLVFEQIDDRLEANIDVLFATLSNCLAKQLGPPRVGAGGQLGQSPNDLLQPLVAICELSLLNRQIGRRCLILLVLSRGRCVLAA